jgi:PTH2 family peptidyl-tRNA hydrolase
MKMVIVVRTDLGMGKGKIAAQVAHAAVSLVVQSSSESAVTKWLCGNPSQTKLVLKAKDLNHLMELESLADKHGIESVAIRDAGHTQVDPGTITVLGLGPDEDSKIDLVTGDLKLL